MSTKIKFSSKLEKRVLEELKVYALQSKRNISVVLNEAVQEYLQRINLRPAFLDAASEVLKEHEELFEKLAK